MFVLEQGLSLLETRLDRGLSSCHASLLLECFSINSSCVGASFVLDARWLAIDHILARVSLEAIDKTLVLKQSSFNFLIFLLFNHVADVLRDGQLLWSYGLAHPIRGN